MASSGTLDPTGAGGTQGNQDGSGAVGAMPTGPQGLAVQDPLFQGPAPQGLGGENPFQGVFGKAPPKAMAPGPPPPKGGTPANAGPPQSLGPQGQPSTGAIPAPSQGLSRWSRG